MGYACPVCDAPQRDAAHLANHLAFVAMLHGDAHEAWLDENAPGWADEDPTTLGERVAPGARPATYDEVFEDTVHDRGRPFADREGGPPDAAGDGPLDETARAALAEARELTRRARADDGDENADDPTAEDGADDADEKA